MEREWMLELLLKKRNSCTIVPSVPGMICSKLSVFSGEHSAAGILFDFMYFFI
jgi:hypothetical protein